MIRIDAARPYPGFGPITAIESAFDSNYHALQVSLRKNFGAAGLISFAYKYSKNMTDDWSDRSPGPQNSIQHAKSFARVALAGWQLSGIASFYTGSPFTVTTSGVDPAVSVSSARARPAHGRT